MSACPMCWLVSHVYTQRGVTFCLKCMARRSRSVVTRVQIAERLASHESLCVSTPSLLLLPRPCSRQARDCGPSSRSKSIREEPSSEAPNTSRNACKISLVVIVPTNSPASVTGRPLILWLSISFAAYSKVARGLTVNKAWSLSRRSSFAPEARVLAQVPIGDNLNNFPVPSRLAANDEIRLCDFGAGAIFTPVRYTVLQ
jgi:hypothetical protein